MIAVALAGVTFFSTGVGGLAAVRFRDRMHLLLGFSAGAVLGVVFFDLLPEVFTLPGGRPHLVMVGAGVGFLAFFGLERATSLHRAREHEHAVAPHDPEMGLVGAIGLSVHSFLDGVAIGIGFQTSAALGLLIALAVIAHDFSDGLNTVTVMLAHGNPLRRSLALLAIDMVTPILGAASTLLFHIPAGVLPWLLAFFCGFFLYIGASDLLPEAREHDSPMVGVATLLGMLALFGVTRAL
ncbi:MAG: ZIP family metal transporter [Candidatus Dormibacteraceae bacterium]